MPGYLAAVCGQEPVTRRADPRVLGRAALFVGAFSLLFMLLGLSATLLGQLLADHRRTLDVVAGAAILTMDAVFVGAAVVPALNRSKHPLALAGRGGRGTPVLAGAAFALAWTPCVGPALGAVLGLAATPSGTAQGGLLPAIYAAGLALPFL